MQRSEAVKDAKDEALPGVESVEVSLGTKNTEIQTARVAVGEVQAKYEVVFRKMRHATRKHFRLSLDISSVCKRLAVEADFVTLGCERWFRAHA